MTIPTRVQDVTEEQVEIVRAWQRATGRWVGFLVHPNDSTDPCNECQSILDMYHRENPAPVTVESVVSLIENIVQSRSIWGTSPSASPYDLYMDTSAGSVHVCGHEDAFWLLGKAEALSFVLDDMTPNITFEIRQGAVVKARIDTEVGIVIKGFE